MVIRSFRLVAFALALSLSSVEWVGAEEADAPLLTTLRQHCGQCHGNGEEIEADVNLAAIDQARLVDDPELVRAVLGVLDRNEMPPEDEPQPSEAVRKVLIRELRSILHESVTRTKTSPRTPIRRMTRFQYNNAVTDLFDLNVIVFTLPERIMREHKGYFRPETGRMADVVYVGNRPLGKSQMIEPRLAGVAAFPQDLRAEHGYDNQADHLSLSPLLMESFLKLGQSITRSKDFTPKNVGIWDSFFASPDDSQQQDAEVRARLEPFLTKAFRRPVDKATLQRYSNYVINQIKSGSDFTDAMKSLAAAVIASPRFLYLYDVTGEKETGLPGDFALASRLSFFLWGSLPDETLLSLAAQGELHRPEVLSAQLTRMLADRKLKRFCDSFPAQWLQLDRLISSVPNQEKYPQFYFSKYRDSMHMMIEPLLLFEAVLIEDQPITQLIDPDFTYRSGHLEEAYGPLQTPPDQQPDKSRKGEVTQLTFYRVPVTDRRNGGVLTNAAVMTMTSGPERTQPITRGAWVASVIFNNPPEPPPADVPPLAEKPTDDEAHLTLRERLAQHRERSDCRGCHEKIDPLGFALENYDPVGIWRTTYENGRDVDVSGTLFRTHQFDDVVEFKDAILAEKGRFTRAFAGHLLSFALARELTATDQIAIDEITERTASEDFRIQSLLREIVLSEPFIRTSDSVATPTSIQHE